jgi:hypothetical protein
MRPSRSLVVASAVAARTPARTANDAAPIAADRPGGVGPAHHA